MRKSSVRYLCKKLIQLLFTLFFVTLLSFLLVRISAVDPATSYAKRMMGNPSEQQIEAIRIQLGFDKPLWIQYFAWVWNLFHLDLGTSLGTGKSVWTELMTAIPKTLELLLIATIIESICITLIGCIIHRIARPRVTKVIQGLCIIGVSVPAFYIATVLLDNLAVKNNWITVAGNTNIRSMIAPAFCLSIFMISFFTPLLLSALKKESEQDYVFYCKSRGLSENRILFFHTLPHAINGLVPSFLQSIGISMMTSTVVEQVFSIPGFGYRIVHAVLDRDSPMIHACVFFMALILTLLDIASELIQWGLCRKGGSET